MKAISVPQPVAWLIVSGHQNLLPKSVITYHRGPLLIHAAKKTLKKRVHGIRIPDHLDIGGIVGMVWLIDCKPNGAGYRKNRWYDGSKFAWLFANAKPLPFVPLAGQISLFNVSDEIIPKLESTPENAVY